MVVGNKRTDDQDLLTLRNVLFLKELQGNKLLRGQQAACNKGKEIVKWMSWDYEKFSAVSMASSDCQ